MEWSGVPRPRISRLREEMPPTVALRARHPTCAVVRDDMVATLGVLIQEWIYQERQEDSVSEANTLPLWWQGSGGGRCMATLPALHAISTEMRGRGLARGVCSSRYKPWAPTFTDAIRNSGPECTASVGVRVRIFPVSGAVDVPAVPRDE